MTESEVVRCPGCGTMHTCPAPAPAVRELAHMKRVCLELGAHKEDIRGQLATAIARISQLEAGLEAALPYVEATNRADHLMDGFGPRSRQSSDDHVAAIRALLKGQS